MASDVNGFMNKNPNFTDFISSKFLFIEKISEFRNLKKLEEVELCVISTDFNKSDLNFIKQVKSENKNAEFWISTNNLSRKNIMTANKIGISNVVASPIENKSIEMFFKKKDINFLRKNSILKSEYESLKGLKVMIVDDNCMNVELLEEVLAELNLEISSYTKPDQACETILHEKFDLFLLDIMMPEISGFDLAKKIQEIPHNKFAPIVFISALSDSENKITGYDLGSYAYIEKPFDINIIRAQIYNILKTRKAQDILSSKKDSFVATVAHDLKTPINAEINALNLLLQDNFGELKEDQQEIIEDILNSTKFMQDMVENLLSKDRIEKGQINLSKQVCSLEEIVMHCIDLTKYILSDKKQKIVFKCKTKNLLVPLDFLEMKRAIHNLIANASQYSPNGSDIIIEIFNQDDKIALSVQDFGRGIAIEYQKDIFSQYMTMAKEYNTIGTGLGLYITKRIVEAHEGEILLDSKLGWGTKITILLPIYTKV